ncbi:MAG: hypothetical protein K6E34_08350, partial [Lachnospiraceae bacterium]|nr:hypothetical protein [Lachnospiraceae bacterium]
MRKSRKKIIVAILLMTMLSQTLYSAAAGIFGLSAQSYAYADDEMTEDVEPGEEVDESTQDDADVVQKAPETESSEGEPATEEEPAAEEEEPKLTAGDASETGGAAASDDELIDEDKEVVDEDTKDNKEEEKEAVEIRLRASYVDSATGSAIKDTEDLDIDAGYLYILKGEAPEIAGYTYDKTTINIEDEDYDITAILTEDLDGKEIYSITTDTDIEEKDTADVSWTQLVKDAVIVLNYSEGEALVEENTVSDNEAVSENEAEESVSDNEAVSENEVSENEAEKRVYEYEDDRIKVTATLERADAVPDDAYFDVTPLTEEEAERYLAALNENKGEDDA